MIAESARLPIDLNHADLPRPNLHRRGLDLEAAEEAAWQPRKPRLTPPPARFRSEVLRGWRNRCAMCGYDGVPVRSGRPRRRPRPLAFAGRPRRRRQWLALCALHHVLSTWVPSALSPDLSVRVSPLYVARSEQGERLVYHLTAGRSTTRRPGIHPERASRRLALKAGVQEFGVRPRYHQNPLV